MKKQLLVLIFILFASLTFAQKKYEAHEVKAGETLYSIAIQYNTSVKKILKYNPSIGKETELPLGQLLIIPSKQKIKETAAYKIHYVKKRETLFGLSHKYNVTEDAIQQANPIIKEKGLMCGLELRIPNQNATNTVPTTSKDTDIKTTNAVMHTVTKGETIYSITHQYGISKEELHKLNPQIKGTDLPIDTVLLIRKTQQTVETATVKTDTIFTKHIVLPKETVYSITHLYNIPKEQLIALNPNYPELKNNVLHPDDVLIVKKIIIKTDAVTNSIDTTFVAEKKSFLSRIIKGKTLDVALLLPIDLKNLDTSNTENLQKKLENKALNRVLDYYNGSVLAIDSIAKLGVNVSVDVYDTASNKSVALLKLIRENKLINKDVIVGPFFPDNVDLVAQNSAEKTLIVAPFNKKPSSYPQVLNAKVSKGLLGRKMLDFMTNNRTDEKIIYIDDEQNPKALAAVLARFKDVTVLKPNEKTKAISIINIRKAVGVTKSGRLINAGKTQKYWVILNAKKDWFIGSVVSAFNSLQGTVDITLFSTGHYKAFNEINPNHLAHLKYHFPATSNIDATETTFSKAYYAKYGVHPSVTATKGFDATFDALLRANVAENAVTPSLLYEYNKGAMTNFQYNKTTAGSYQNEAVQILKYTQDLHQVAAESIK